jgi:uncharacterized protein (DUF1778 family)
MEITKQEKARFDTRLSKEQKQYFERAALLGGFRNLTDFVIKTVQKKAQDIITQNEKILSSEQDAEIFFNELTNPSKPKQALIDAVAEYNNILNE